MIMLDELIKIAERLSARDYELPSTPGQCLQSAAADAITAAYEWATAVDGDDWQAARETLQTLMNRIIVCAQITEFAQQTSRAEVTGSLSPIRIDSEPEPNHLRVLAGLPERCATDLVRARPEAANSATRDRSDRAGDSVFVASALNQALELQLRAAQVGFDWNDVSGPLRKVLEEYTELSDAWEKHDPPARLVDEMGDLLFACVNLARHLEVDSNLALQQACKKFERRFCFIEHAVQSRGGTIAATEMQTLEDLWQQAKLQGY